MPNYIVVFKRQVHSHWLTALCYQTYFTKVRSSEGKIQGINPLLHFTTFHENTSNLPCMQTCVAFLCVSSLMISLGSQRLNSEACFLIISSTGWQPMACKEIGSSLRQHGDWQHIVTTGHPDGPQGPSTYLSQHIPVLHFAYPLCCTCWFSTPLPASPFTLLLHW